MGGAEKRPTGTTPSSRGAFSPTAEGAGVGHGSVRTRERHPYYTCVTIVPEGACVMDR